MPQSIKEKVKALDKTNRLITDNLVDAVWVIDAQTLKYEYITPSIQRISGYTAEELIGTTILDRLTPESSEKRQLSKEIKPKQTADSQAPILVLPSISPNTKRLSNLLVWPVCPKKILFYFGRTTLDI
jgi:PAS domain-containing protein